MRCPAVISTQFTRRSDTFRALAKSAALSTPRACCPSGRRCADGQETEIETRLSPRSEIIEQCLIYAQSIAAYNAGFYVDPTGDFDYAGCGDSQLGRHHFRNAKRALIKLVALGEDVPAPSRDELFAKARVAHLLQGTDAKRNPEKHEAQYVIRLAKDVPRPGGFFYCSA
jgi:hypothetical protein